MHLGRLDAGLAELQRLAVVVQSLRRMSKELDGYLCQQMEQQGAEIDEELPLILEEYMVFLDSCYEERKKRIKGLLTLSR